MLKKNITNTILSASLLWLATTANAQNDWTGLDKLESRAIDATVSITLTPLRQEGAKLVPVNSKRQTGHGVRISRKGVIYTAAHVVVPTKAWLKTAGAQTYTITIDHIGVYSQRITSASMRATDYSEYARIGADTVKCNSDIRIRCLANDVVSPHQDYALLVSNHQHGSFIDILGTEDDLTQRSGKPDMVATIARFKNGNMRTDRLTRGWNWHNYRATKSNDVWKVSSDDQDYHCGISGAPLIGFFRSRGAQKDAIAVIGVVNNGLPWRAVKPDSACNGSNAFLTSIFKYHKHQTEIYSFLKKHLERQKEPWDCDFGTDFHSPNSALSEFFTLEDNLFNENQRRKSIDCFGSLPTWDATALIALNDNGFIATSIDKLRTATYGYQFFSPGINVKNCIRIAGEDSSTCLETTGAPERKRLAAETLEELNKKNISLSELISAAKESGDPATIEKTNKLENDSFIQSVLNNKNHKTVTLDQLSEKERVKVLITNTPSYRNSSDAARLTTAIKETSL